MNLLLSSIKKITRNEFFNASIWVFLAMGVLNAGNYFYHLLMGRMLGPESYGVLESTISFLYILSVPFMTLNLIIVKFVSSYKGKQDYKSISGFYFYLRKNLFIFGLIATLIILLLSPIIVSLLHLPSILFPIFIGINFLIGLFSVLIKSMLQGFLKFFPFFVANVTEVLSKIILAVILVILGFKAIGAYFALVASVMASYLVASYFVKKEKLSFEKFTESRKIFKYSVPVFLTTLSLTSLFTTDIVLVRFFFPGVESGYYAALSVLGKVIFFASSPLTIVMFPLVSEKHAVGKKFQHLMFTSFGFTAIIALVLIAIYYLFPESMVGILFGSQYLRIVPLLGIFGVFIGIYSLCALLANFYLSIHKKIVSFFVMTAAILQIFLIILFHRDLLQIINISIIIASILLIVLIAYYPFSAKQGTVQNPAKQK